MQLETVDVDGLIEAWADIWVQQCNPNARVAWIDVTGELENLSEDSKLRLKERTRSDHPDCSWPARMTMACLDDSTGVIERTLPQPDFSDSVDVSTRLKAANPMILFAYENGIHSDIKRVQEQENTFEFSRKVRQSMTVKTNRKIHSKIKAGFNILGTGITSTLAYTINEGHAETAAEESTITQTFKHLSFDTMVVLEASTQVCMIKRKIVLSGYVVIKSDTAFLPGQRYTHHGYPHKKWVIPIHMIFDDLNEYQKTNKLPSKLTQSLATFEPIERTRNEVTAFVEYSCEVLNAFNFVSHLKSEVKARFQKQMETYKEALIAYNKKGLKIERLFVDAVPLETYYAELKVLQGEEFQKRERYLKVSSSRDGIEGRETLLSYDGMLGVTDKAGQTETITNLMPSLIKGKVLITGTAGVGKTTLSKKLSSEHNSWCFLIPIRNLTAERYPLREKHYSFAEILVREAFPLEISERILSLLDNNLFEDYITNITRGSWEPFPGFIYCNETSTIWGDDTPTALVILDGYDERNIPKHLEHVFRLLMTCRNLIVTSRPYNLNGLREQYDFQQNSWFEVTGFDAPTIKRYIHAFFNALPSLTDKEKTRYSDELFAHLDTSPYILGACKIPVNCEMVCTAWASGDMDSSVRNMAGLYNSLLASLAKRYVKKFIPQTKLDTLFEDLTETKIRELCRYQIAFAEYFAFDSLNQGNLFLSPNKTEAHLPTDYRKDSIVQQKQFGFIKPSSEFGHTGGGKFYFSHLTFRDYFAARYIATALQKAALSDEEAISPYFETFYIQKNKKPSDVVSFIQARKFEPAFEYVIWFIVGLLAEANDIKTITYFYRILFNEPRDVVGVYNALLLVRCLDQSQQIIGKCDEAYISQLSEFVQTWLTYTFTRTDFPVSPINALWERLKLNKLSLQGSVINHTFIDKSIREADEHSLSKLIELFKAVSFLDLKTVQVVATMLINQIARLSLKQRPKEHYYQSVMALILETSTGVSDLNHQSIMEFIREASREHPNEIDAIWQGLILAIQVLLIKQYDAKQLQLEKCYQLPEACSSLLNLLLNLSNNNPSATVKVALVKALSFPLQKGVEIIIKSQMSVSNILGKTKDEQRFAQLNALFEPPQVKAYFEHLLCFSRDSSDDVKIATAEALSLLIQKGVREIMSLQLLLFRIGHYPSDVLEVFFNFPQIKSATDCLWDLSQDSSDAVKIAATQAWFFFIQSEVEGILRVIVLDQGANFQLSVLRLFFNTAQVKRCFDHLLTLSNDSSDGVKNAVARIFSSLIKTGVAALIGQYSGKIPLKEPDLISFRNKVFQFFVSPQIKEVWDRLLESNQDSSSSGAVKSIAIQSLSLPIEAAVESTIMMRETLGEPQGMRISLSKLLAAFLKLPQIENVLRSISNFSSELGNGVVAIAIFFLQLPKEDYNNPIESIITQHQDYFFPKIKFKENSIENQAVILERIALLRKLYSLDFQTPAMDEYLVALLEAGIPAFNWKAALALLEINVVKSIEMIEKLNAIIEATDALDKYRELLNLSTRMKNNASKLKDIKPTQHSILTLLSILLANTPESKILEQALRLKHTILRRDFFSVLIQKIVQQGKACFLKEGKVFLYEDKAYIGFPLDQITEEEFREDIADCLNRFKINPKPIEPSSELTEFDPSAKENEGLKREVQALKRENQVLVERLSQLQQASPVPITTTSDEGYVTADGEDDLLGEEVTTCGLKNPEIKRTGKHGERSISVNQFRKPSQQASFFQELSRKKLPGTVSYKKGENGKAEAIIVQLQVM